MAKIQKIIAREILDSRANKTIEVDVALDSGIVGRASVPSGSSTGRYEAYKITDIPKAVANVEILSKSIIGQDVSEQEKIDLMMINTDGSGDKSNLGANSILAISLAVCEAAAKSLNVPLYKYISKISGLDSKVFRLPVPMFNVINGGKHADNNIAFQEFMIIPVGSESFKRRLEIGDEIFHELKKDLHRMGLSTNVGDEGGFAPRLNSNEEALELIVDAITKSGYKPREQAAIGLDVAASAIADLSPITYPLSPLNYYEKITNDYPIVLLEDPLTEDDWQSWVSLNEKIGKRVNIVGDDLFSTNEIRLKQGIEKKAANGIVIKPDQIGTLTETFKTIRLAKQAGYNVTISHRAGETESTFISDLAVGVGAEYIKTGAPSRGERVAKYNQLLRIEEELQ